MQSDKQPLASVLRKLGVLQTCTSKLLKC